MTPPTTPPTTPRTTATAAAAAGPGTFVPAPGAAPVLRQVLTQASMEARLMLRNGEQLLLAVVIPVIVLLVGVRGAERVDLEYGVETFAPGVLALAVMSTSFTALAIATGFERRYGLIKRLGTSPLSRTSLLGAKVLALLVVEVLQVVVIGAVALALGWEPDASVVGLLLTVVLGTSAFASLGLLLAGSLRAEATLAAANLVYLLLMAGGAVVLPASAYGSFGDVVAWLPSGALGEAMRSALAGATVAWRDLLVLAGWTVVGAVATARTFKWE
ncbi:ABC transporter permease [Nocardioides dongxiaopingii]|uniref:ABC transporter permease n=1 Tax=Nocardioides dongxiaopingii TaxID=2576036 RepID=UPI0010C762F1|nr:ABC transporter permease [Nocardioides dongxiaopingii]